MYLHLQLISLSHFLYVRNHTEFSIALHPAFHIYGLLFFHIVYNSSHLDFHSFGLFHVMEDIEIRLLVSHPLDTGNLLKE